MNLGEIIGKSMVLAAVGMLVLALAVLIWGISK